ncbi:MAG: deoxyribodipyrimidine photo-lyase [Desulfuromonadaceae bacterium]|nr:deoxyribodipyrimidine photo-lyase [Desulfuromonadaceae bacterium]
MSYPREDVLDSPRVIMWFRTDLRLQDNPALYAAAQQGTVIPVFVHETEKDTQSYAGVAGQWWLHHSLIDLQRSLRGALRLYQGSAATILSQLCRRYNVQEVFYNRNYTPTGMALERMVEQALLQEQVSSSVYNGNYLWVPDSLTKADGTPYQVFTPFYRNVLEHAPLPHFPLPVPSQLELLAVEPAISDEIDVTDPAQFQLLPHHPWIDKLALCWDVGEQAAHARIREFVGTDLLSYSGARDFPATNGVSRLAPYLAWGQVSPNQLWHASEAALEESIPAGLRENARVFRRQLGWREFSTTQLYANPHMRRENLRAKFDKFPWRKNTADLQRWQRGLTGYPLVDAGMRELWDTGYMHNRVRMVVGSFLVKNLLLHWRHGEDWFRDCLLDADYANNCASWQWVAGCGADAAPYFRIFNPVTQARKFDPHAAYVRRFVPQLRELPLQYIFEPWKAPATVLRAAGIELGHNYPYPCIDLKASRQRALGAYAQIKQSP